jgi:hypothetical protein
VTFTGVPLPTFRVNEPVASGVVPEVTAAV